MGSIRIIGDMSHDDDSLDASIYKSNNTLLVQTTMPQKLDMTSKLQKRSATLLGLQEKVLDLTEIHKSFCPGHNHMKSRYRHDFSDLQCGSVRRILKVETLRMCCLSGG